MSTGWIVFTAIMCFLAGIVLGYFVTRFVFKREIKKNPPVNEKMIRAMYRSMGRTPSESQVRATMRSMDEARGQ